MSSGRAAGPTHMDLYSVMCVRDRARSVAWFAVFFGREADEVIGEEYLWQVGEHAWVVVDDREVRAERVGGAMVTFGVTGLDEILAGGDVPQRRAPRGGAGPGREQSVARGGTCCREPGACFVVATTPSEGDSR